MQGSQKHHLARITGEIVPLYSMKGSCFISYQDLSLVGLEKEVCKQRGGGLERLDARREVGEEVLRGNMEEREKRGKERRAERGEERTTEGQDVRK